MKGCYVALLKSRAILHLISRRVKQDRASVDETVFFVLSPRLILLLAFELLEENLKIILNFS